MLTIMLERRALYENGAMGHVDSLFDRLAARTPYTYDMCRGANMNKMVRKQLFVTTEQNRRLKVRAAATGRSEGEVMRRGINRELDDETGDASGDWKDAWREAFGIWKDRDDIEELAARRRKATGKRMERTRKLLRGE
jgi:hypothetical protein